MAWMMVGSSLVPYSGLVTTEEYYLGRNKPFPSSLLSGRKGPRCQPALPTAHTFPTLVRGWIERMKKKIQVTCSMLHAVRHHLVSLPHRGDSQAPLGQLHQGRANQKRHVQDFKFLNINNTIIKFMLWQHLCFKDTISFCSRLYHTCQLKLLYIWSQQNAQEQQWQHHNVS